MVVRRGVQRRRPRIRVASPLVCSTPRPRGSGATGIYFVLCLFCPVVMASGFVVLPPGGWAGFFLFFCVFFGSFSPRAAGGATEGTVRWAEKEVSNSSAVPDLEWIERSPVFQSWRPLNWRTVPLFFFCGPPPLLFPGCLFLSVRSGGVTDSTPK